jgi:hypothetical protein
MPRPDTMAMLKMANVVEHLKTTISNEHVAKIASSTSARAHLGFTAFEFSSKNKALLRELISKFAVTTSPATSAESSNRSRKGGGSHGNRLDHCPQSKALGFYLFVADYLRGHFDTATLRCRAIRRPHRAPHLRRTMP